MKQFVKRTILFASLAFLLLGFALFVLPNPALENNMLSALLDKHELLRKTNGPKIVIIGGSNTAFGLDSKRIQDAVYLPVVNAGLHANLGMKFYLTDVQRYINEGDVVVVIPEYSQFTTDAFYGKMELVSTLFDIHRDGIAEVNTKQWGHLIQFIPFYAASKLRLTKGFNPNTPIGVYDRRAFNSYGDAHVHWGMPGKKVKVAQKAKEEDHVNPEAIQLLVDFQKLVESKKATMLLFPPVFQSSSFVNQKLIIDKIYHAIKENQLRIVAKPERYKLPDSVFYDTFYHLRRPGIERRSDLLIEDIGRELGGEYISRARNLHAE